MKRKKVAALVVAAVVGTTLVVPLAACGDDEDKVKDLKISDYIQSYSDYAEESGKTNENDVVALSKLTNLNVDGEYEDAYFSSYGVTVKSVEEGTNTVYRLYNAKTNGYVNDTKYTAAEQMPVKIGTTYSTIHKSSPFFKVTVGSGADEVISLVTCSGAKVISDMDDTNLNSLKLVKSDTEYYVQGTEGLQTIYIVKYDKVIKATSSDEEDTTEQVTLYFYAERAYESDGETYEYTGKILQVAVSDLALSREYEAGNLLQPIYEKTVDGDIADYSYSLIDGVYQFYNEGDKVDTLALSDDMSALGFLGNYLYYAKVQPVSDSATKGYNLYINGNKANYTYYKYNIITGQTQEFTPEYALTQFIAQYNYTTKQYDAAIAYGYAKVGDVAQQESHCLIIDDEGVVFQDISQYDVTNFASVKALSDNRYVYLGGYSYGINGYEYVSPKIIDENLETVAEFSTIYAIYPEAKLLRVYENDSLSFVNYDGELAISNEFHFSSSPVFYGGHTYAYKILPDSTYRYYIVSGYNGSESEVDTEDTAYAFDPSMGYTNKVGLYITRTETSGGENTYSYNVYNYGGRILSTVSGNAIEAKKVNGKVYVIVTFINSQGKEQKDIYLAS